MEHWGHQNRTWCMITLMIRFCNTTSLFKVVLYVETPKQWFHIAGKYRQGQNIRYATMA